MHWAEICEGVPLCSLGVIVFESAYACYLILGGLLYSLLSLPKEVDNLVWVYAV